MENISKNVEGKLLDTNQQNSILSNAKRILVVAGAGSGKTTTIVGKVKYLLQVKNIDAKNILVLSFTNASAKEMRERILKEVDVAVDAITFHKLGLNILEKSNLNDYKILTDNVNLILLDILNDLVKDKLYLDNLISYIYENKNKSLLKLAYKVFESESYLKLDFINLCFKFLNLVKQNGFDNHRLLVLSKNKAYQLFLQVFLPIFDKYQTHLLNNKLIDFNDMINISKKNIESKSVLLPYKEIIVDEFQDLSQGRYSLLQAILKVNEANLFCVGDDYQCIFSFAGSELNYFVKFRKYFGNYEKYIIDKTYRFNQNLVDISEKFVTKNPIQLKKKVKSFNNDLSRSVEIIIGEDDEDILSKLIDTLIGLPNYSKVFILGRYNGDLNLLNKSIEFDIIHRSNEVIFAKKVDLKIFFLTVHRAKGLEADFTFIINNKNGKYGFPSNKKNEKILDYLKLKKEFYPFGEERRLFYVAITRSRKKTYLLCIKDDYSIFIKDILKQNKKSFKTLKSFLSS